MLRSEAVLPLALRRKRLGIRASVVVASCVCSMPLEAPRAEGAEPPEAGPSTPSPRAMTFSWVAPDGCPSEARVRGQIERHLGRRLDEVRTEVESIDVVVTENDGQLHLVITTQAPLGNRSRELTHESCTSLANAASVIVAIALDPTAVEHLAEDLDADPRPVDPAPADTPPPAPLVAAPTATAPGDEIATFESSSEPSDAALHFSVSVAGQSGVLPHPGPGVDATVGLSWRSFMGAVHGDFWIPQRYVFPDLPDANVDVELWTVGAFAGPRLVWPHVQWVPLGAGFELGPMTARPAGLERQRTSRSLWAGASLVSSVEVKLTAHLSVVLRGEGVFAVARQQYVVDGFGLTHLPDRFGGRAALGLGWTTSGG